jgi:hypothetical protein
MTRWYAPPHHWSVAWHNLDALAAIALLSTIDQPGRQRLIARKALPTVESLQPLTDEGRARLDLYGLQRAACLEQKINLVASAVPPKIERSWPVRAAQSRTKRWN